MTADEIRAAPRGTAVLCCCSAEDFDGGIPLDLIHVDESV
jgi:hypothetical protein